MTPEHGPIGIHRNKPQIQPYFDNACEKAEPEERPFSGHTLEEKSKGANVLPIVLAILFCVFLCLACSRL